MSNMTEGAILWQPSAELREQASLTRYMRWLEDQHGTSFEDYAALWQWSVADVERFWASIWEFFEIKSSAPYTQVLTQHEMPGARWFVGAQINFAEHVFRNATTDRPAMIFQSELRPLTEISWTELQQKVAAIAAALRGLGVQPGDRVVAYMPNIPEAVVAVLACANIGAIWSSCSPDFGSPSVIDRFKQIEPKVLIAVDGYHYGGKPQDRRAVVAELQQALPTLEKTILVAYLDQSAGTADLPNTVAWGELLSAEAELRFEQVPFDHPLWVLYSSGTTGLPKPIVQSQGGILLEHLKSISLQKDLKPEDRFFWFSTTGWMMWNFLVGGLLVGCTILLYDGSPGWPDLGRLWEFAQNTGMTCFGTSAAYIAACMKAGIEPNKAYDLSRLRSMGSTGSPLPPEGFQWVYDHIKPDLWLISTSGGTDVCTSFVTGCPLLPVYRGEIQCRALGADVQSWNEDGQPVIDEVGELVLTQPMPSMPLYFWNDPDNQRYRESYFEMFPGVWRHGDWVKITSRDSVVIYGRSDSTINRQGVRMGTSEIYRTVEDIPEVMDSLVVDLEGLGGSSYMPLFVVLKPGVELNDDLKTRINSRIRSSLSPRHVPNEIYAIPEIPRTLSGKKLEVPVKKIMLGVPIEKAANPDSMSNPHVLRYFVDLAASLDSARQSG
ncbi:MAG TPA: acetoacetate--CoA ligase [Herpetosiphonaceae bacterium]